MDNIIRLVGPERAVELFGVRLVGVNAENGKKLLFTLALFLLTWALFRIVHFIARRFTDPDHPNRPAFWAMHLLRVATAILLVFGVMSIWFDDPTRLATAFGLITAGLAFALQKVVTAIAGYVVILRGQTFRVGDRIVMGGVRGDVVALGFMQTTIMEMGQPPPTSPDNSANWIRSRQYTGRVVTVSNARIFDDPVFNYTREFPFIWEELTLPITYAADRARAEQILLDVAQRHATPAAELASESIDDLSRRYFMPIASTQPRVYWRLTNNWLELTVRFIVPDHGARNVKDAMSRDLLAALDEARIGVASSTFEIIGLPNLRIRQTELG